MCHQTVAIRLNCLRNPWLRVLHDKVRIWRWLFTLEAFLLFAINPVWAQTGRSTYFVTNLAALGMTDARDLNNKGEVAGNGGQRGMVYSGGVMTVLSTLGGNWSEASAINDSGVVVGTSELSPGYPYPHAFRYSGGTMTDLGSLPGGNGISRAYGINNAGQIVGVSSWPYGSVSFLFSGGTMSNFWPNTLGHYAVGINNAGQIVLNVTAPYFLACYRYSDGVPIEVGRPGGLTGSSHGTAINNSGQVVGWFTTNSGEHAFRYDGVLTDLGTLGGSSSRAYGINNNAQIVGTSTTSNGVTHGFLYSGGTMTDISAVPDLTVARLEWDTAPGALRFTFVIQNDSSSASSTWLPVAINDQGQILCSSGILLTPSPPPSACAQLFWADSASNKVSATPIFSRTIPTDFVGNSAPVQIPASSLQNPPTNATHALLVLNCDGQFPESNTNNNTRTLNLAQPDMLPASMAWDSTNGGIDFSYTVQPGTVVRAATTVELFWANGIAASDRMGGAIFAQTIPANFSGQSSNIHVPASAFNNPPGSATHVLLLVDPQNLVTESSEDNNVLAASLVLPDLFPNSFNFTSGRGGLDFSYTVRTGFVATAATTAKIFWANGPTLSQVLPGLPLFSTSIPAAANGQSGIVHVPVENLATPPNGTTHILLALDADKLVTEANETNNTLAIDFENEATELSGRVLDAANRAPIEGATVNVGGRIATTSTTGEYVINGVPTVVTNLLIVTKSGYATNRTTIIVPPRMLTKAVRDIFLGPDGAFIITGIEPLYDGLFLSGVQFLNKYTAMVNWAGRTPGKIDFYISDKLIQSVTTETTEATASIDMTEFPGRLFPSKIKAVAVDAAGATSPPFERTVCVLPMPEFVASAGPLSVGSEDGSIVIRFEIELPPGDGPSDTFIEIPKFDRIAKKWRASASVEYKVLSGEWNFEATSPTVEWRWGTWSAKANVGISAQNTATEESGWIVDDVGVSFDLSGEHEILKLYLLQLVPGGEVSRVFDGLSLVGMDINSLQRIIINGSAELQADLTYDLANRRWEPGTVGEKLGAEALYRPRFLGAEADISASLTGNLTFKFTKNDVAWQLGGEGSFSLKTRIWSETLAEVNAVLFSGTKSSSNWGSIASKNRMESVWNAASGGEGFAILVADTTPRPMSRNYLASGPEVFMPKGVADPGRDKLGGGNNLIRFRLVSSTSDHPAAAGSLNSIADLPAAARKEKLRNAVKQADLALVQNVFPGASPALAAHGKELMLLYAADSGVSNSLQFTDINWLKWDGTNWSAPAAIANNPRGQFSPVVTYDGNGDAIALWEQMADPNFNETNLTAMAAEMEIAWSRWSRIDGTWSTPLALTANLHLDHAPLLCGPMANGNVIALWTENSANLIIATNGIGADKVWWSEWSAASRSWIAPQVLLSGLTHRLSQSLAGSAGRAVYVWTSDADGILTNDTDQEMFVMEYTNGVWGAPRQFTTNEVADRNVRAAVTTNGTALLIWQNGTNLVFSRNFSSDFSVARPDSQSAGFLDYAMTVGPAGNVVLLWEDISTNGSDVHYSVYDPISGVWGADDLLCQDAPLETAFAPVWDDDGNLTLAYEKVQIGTTTKTLTLTNGDTLTLTNVLEAGRVDLAITKRALVKDLKLADEDFKVDGLNFLPGDQLRLAATVRNTGNLAVSNVVVNFYSGNPAAGGLLVATGTSTGWLAAATSAVVTATWIVPEPATNYTLYAVANPDGLAGEFDPSNNTAHGSIGGTALAVALLRKDVETNGSVRIVAQVQNLGAPTATNCTLSVRVAGATNALPLAAVAVPALKPGRTAELALQLPPGTQPPGESIYTLAVDEARLNSDVNTNNNQTRFAVTLWLDTDGDGMPDHWELANHLNPYEASDASGDPDHDGLSNLEEYLQGSDPGTFSNLRILTTKLLSGDRIQLRSIVEVGRKYELQASTNLMVWDTIMTFSATNSPMAIEAFDSTHFPQRYYRLRLGPDQPPLIAQQPVSRTNVTRTTATFTATVTGSAPLNYQWRKDGLALKDGGNVSGAMDATLTLANVQMLDAGDFDLVISNNYGSVTSQVATLVVQSALPAGLLLYLPFEGNAKDASGHGRDAVVEGATLTSDRFGHADSAYAVSGSQYLHVEGLDPDDYSNGFSFGGWVRLTTVGGSLVYWVHDQGWGSSFILFDGGFNSLHLRCGSGNPASDHSVSGLSLAQDQWQHIFITHGSSVDRLYVGGSLIGEWPAYPLQGNVSTLNIGWDGGAKTVDEIAVYGRELSAFEIADVYHASYLMPVSSLTLDYFSSSSSNFNFAASGSIGLTATIERAPHLAGPWTNIGSVFIGTNGVGLFKDANPPTGAAFYRAMRK